MALFLRSIAGSDTTASAIRMTFLCLLTTPLAYATLHKEIDDNIAAGKLSSSVRDDETKTLPYLQAVIKEALRVYPAASPMLYKQVPKGGDTINGYTLPAGTQVGTNMLSIMRSKEVFGPDAGVFRPERWIEETNADKLKLMTATWDLSFGCGKFYCLGKTLALMELGKVFVEVSPPNSPIRRGRMVLASTNLRILAAEAIGLRSCEAGQASATVEWAAVARTGLLGKGNEEGGSRLS
jgi:cytochrome P450